VIIGSTVFVLPQYNWGYPAPLKNALDYLYYEWHDKPVASVTYGTRGGNRAADQMNQLFHGLHMRPLPDRVELIITDDDVDEQWQLKDLEATMSPTETRCARSTHNGRSAQRHPGTTRGEPSR
jgi:NAD(P)H-dependent FMN reductase